MCVSFYTKEQNGMTDLLTYSHVFNENEDIHEGESDNEIKLYMMCGTQ